MVSTTYAGAFRPSVARNAVLYDVATVLAGTVLLAVCARITFYVGPVPLTAQTFAVLLVGALLGSRRGAACILTYIVEGVAGLPVFTGGAGPAYMAGPTGGYLVGFVVAAYVVGLLAERGWDRRPATTATMMVAGLVVLYACGVAWLTVLMGFGKALAVGLYPFLIGEVAKVCLATALLPLGWKCLGPIGQGKA